MRVVEVMPSLPLPFGAADARWLHVMVSEQPLVRTVRSAVCPFGEYRRVDALMRAIDEESADVDLIDRSIELLQQPVERAPLGVAGRQLVDDVYSPEPAADRLVTAYQRLGIGAVAERST